MNNFHITMDIDKVVKLPRSIFTPDKAFDYKNSLGLVFIDPQSEIWEFQNSNDLGLDVEEGLKISGTKLMVKDCLEPKVYEFYKKFGFVNDNTCVYVDDGEYDINKTAILPELNLKHALKDLIDVGSGYSGYFHGDYKAYKRNLSDKKKALNFVKEGREVLGNQEFLQDQFSGWLCEFVDDVYKNKFKDTTKRLNGNCVNYDLSKIDEKKASIILDTLEKFIECDIQTTIALKRKEKDLGPER